MDYEWDFDWDNFAGGYDYTLYSDDDDDDYSHYYNDDTPLTTYTIVICAVSAFLSLLSILGCIFMFLLMMSAKYRKRSFAVFLCVQSVVDMMYLNMTSLEDYNNVVIYGFGFQYGFIYKTDVVGDIQYLFGDGLQWISSWFLMLLSVDRYIAICYPLRHPLLCTRRRSIILSGLLVVGGLGIQTWYVKSPPAGGLFVGILPKYILKLFIPTPIIAFLNVKIIVAIKNSAKETSDSKSRVDKNVIKVTLSLTIVCLVSVITYLPMNIFEIIENIYNLYGLAKYDILWQCFNNLNLSNYCMNFYLLLLTGSTYRADMAGILCRKSGAKTGKK